MFPGACEPLPLSIAEAGVGGGGRFLPTVATTPSFTEALFEGVGAHWAVPEMAPEMAPEKPNLAPNLASLLAESIDEYTSGDEDDAEVLLLNTIDSFSSTCH